ncbi:MAG TPA: bifunctional enoyl-CoA hydratase/phosphate acetyltransferase [Pseudolabrys sp.]|nr:bifunctional enoyl-CoA hydratase/phosphate acetyltransferase [Pseudolabrys sp.]
MQFIENKTFNEIKVGDSAELTRTLRQQDFVWLAPLPGDSAPGVDAAPLSPVACHAWGAALLAAVLDTELPGPGAVLLGQTLKFRHAAALGDAVTARVKVRDKIAGESRIVLDCEGVGASGEVLFTGQADVTAPAQKIRRPRAALAQTHIHERGEHFRALTAAARKNPPIRTAIIHPCDDLSLAGAMEAGKAGLIIPVLVGPTAKIRKTAAAAGIDLGGVELIDAPHSHAAAARAVALARDCQVEALMKGSLHTDEVMAAVVDATTGLRTERRISHVFVLDVPNYPKPLLVTDAAVNIDPDLDEKRDIVQNAIDLAQAIGIGTPKVAVLCAVETVYPKIKSTLDAAAICKMADRGQITGGLVDGPLAFDNAISKAAAQAKNIVSPVAGDADILVVPDIDAGNMVAKQLVYLAGADAAGIVLGARVPIMLTSRADNVLARTTSCALAQLFAHRRPGAGL